MQFVTAGSTSINLGINADGQYCPPTSTVDIITTCAVSGDPFRSGNNSSNDPIIVRADYLADGSSPALTMVASAGQVGGYIHGLAFDATNQRLFSANALKRHVSLGRDRNGNTTGGTIYLTNLNATLPNASIYIDLVNDLGINVGQSVIPNNTTRGLPALKGDPSRDAAVFSLVGKAGLGDIDISSDNSTLYVVNLFDRRVYAIPTADVDNGAPYSHSVLPDFPNYSSGCNNGVARPFGLKFHDGDLFLGVVCTGESNTTTNTNVDLTATVYRYDADNSSGGGWSTAITFPLTYNKGFVQETEAGTTQWLNWTDNFVLGDLPATNQSSATFDNGPFDNSGIRPQPILSDIEFDEDGSMILAFLDRTGHQLGHRNWHPTTGSALITGITGGDILRTYRNPSTGAFELENDGKAGPYTSSGTGTTQEGPGGMNADQGPGTGEFFWSDYYTPSTFDHSELSNGGLGICLGTREVVLTAFDPVAALDAGGYITFNSTNGARVRQVQLYFDAGSPPGTGTTGKANGTGDIEFQITPPPIEIGNRVWNDIDGDGIQDASEPGIGNVTVELFADFNNDGTPDGGALATTTTATSGAIGTYYFNNSNVTDGDPTVSGNQAGPQPGKRYLIRIGSADWSGGNGVGDLIGFVLTTANVGGSGQADVRDSDAELRNNIPTISYLTGAVGQNDHTLDFGFVPFSVPPASFVCGSGVQVNVGVVSITNDDVTCIDVTTLGVNPAEVDSVWFLGFARMNQPTSFTFSSANGINLVMNSPNISAGGNGFYYFRRATGDGSTTYCAKTAGNNRNDARSFQIVVFSSPSGATGGYAVGEITDFIFHGETNPDCASISLPVEPGEDPTKTVNTQLIIDDIETTPVRLNVTITAGSVVDAFTIDNSFTSAGGEAIIVNRTTNNVPQTVTNVTIQVCSVSPIGESAFLGTATVNTSGACRKTGSIGNYVWLDENSDGLQDAGEPGIANVQVNLKNAGGTVIATTYTDSEGKYLFPNLAAGMYFVDVVDGSIPTGYTQTTSFTNVVDGTDADTDTDDGDLGNKDHSGLGYKITLDAGEENLTADFGYNTNPTDDVNNGTNTASIGDRVWIDSDGDGVQDANEVGVSGVTVSLMGAGADGIFGTGDDVTATTTTNSNGYYLFDGLTPGAYMVTVTNSATASHNVLTAGQYTQTGDPDHFAEPVANAPAGTSGDNKTTKPIVLAPGDVFLNADFGYQPSGAQLGSIGNTVWLDADADGNGPSGVNGDAFNGAGLQNDNNETPIAGVSVALIRDLDGDGVWDVGEPIIATDVTDANGQYLFAGLPITDGTGTDDYIVWVNDADNVLAGLKPTYDANGGTVSTASGVPTGVASSTRLGISSVSNLTATPVTNQDFGYTPAAQDPAEGLIGDYVWYDTDRDGVQDANESGIEGVLMELWDLGADNAIGGSGANADVLIATTRTDENGYYYFGGLFVDANGEGYQVKVAASNFNAGQPLNGLENTFDPDNGAAAPNDNMGGAVSLTTASPINLMQDFGYVGDDANPLGSIGNLVWEDTNANGVRDAGEPPIAGVTIDLYRDLNGDEQLNPGEPLIGTTTTDANGNYLFSQLPLGSYIVDVTDEVGLLTGYWHSLGNQSPAVDNNSKSDAFAVTINAGTPNNLNVDFGYYKDPAAVGNYVWLDSNGNGLQDAGDLPLAGVQVTLTITYANATVTTLVTTTNANGFYEFPNLLLDEDHAIGAGTGANGENPTSVNATPNAPKFVISVSTTQSVLTTANLLPTQTDVATATNDLNDSDAFTGVVAIPVQGNNNTQAVDPVTNENKVASYDFGVTVYDFGDLPQSYGTAAAIIGSPDTNNDGIPDGTNGAVWAGIIVDEESMQKFSTSADGDDNPPHTSSGGDDEDGLEFPNVSTLITGQTYNFTVITNSNSPTSITRYYALWIDWNGDGDFNDVGEFFSDDVSGIGPVTELKAITVPANALIGSFPGVRLVVSANPISNSFASAFVNGEVEDYLSTVALPIELLDFTATTVDNEKVLLKWTTASEKDNAYFSVQRSRDGVNWQEIGQVKGAGNSQTKLHYLDWDNNPMVGANYYRLQQFDYDGASSFSPIRTAEIKGKQGFSALLYPNPGADRFNLQVTDSSNRTLVISIYNAVGAQVQMRISGGINTDGLYKMDTSEYPSGLYFIRISDEQGRTLETLQMIKK